MNMNKKLHATIGLSAAILALGLSSSAVADEQELPVSLPATEALDNTSFENLVVENIPASAVDVSLANESANTATTANPATEVNSASTAILSEEVTAPAPTIENTTPVNLEESSPVVNTPTVDERVSEVRIHHIRRTTEASYSQFSSQKDVLYTTIKVPAFTEYDTSAFAPATVTDENGKTWYFAKYDDIVLNNKSNYGAPKKGIASSPMIDVTYFYDDVDLAPTVAQQARFVDDKGQEIAPIQVNMVRRDIDLAYYAYFPTAPETIQANGKTYKLQSTDDQEIKSHKIRISNTVTITYIYKEVTEGTAEKPVTPVTPVTPTSTKKLRLPKGNNGAKTRIPVNYKHQTNSSNQGTTKLRLPRGNNGVKTRVPAKKNTPILAVDYL
ncbi:hypothetical protein [Streptococcus salivarius]|uniref:hypothetical protein n=1 Tax=Streptococcus salivarius TaxID=1304 RepID=UPI003CCC78DA